MSLSNSIRFILAHPLNRNQKLQAIARYLRWQLGSRLVSGAVAHDWIGGSKFLVRIGETGLTGNIYTGLHEFEDMAYLLHVLREDDLFIDVGANVGSYLILACCVSGARCVAFEPIPETFERLTDNVRLNRLESRAICRNIGLGSEKGVLRFTGDQDSMNHVMSEGEECKIAVDVEVSRMDKVLKDECPSLIKIDAEGFELPILEGGREILATKSLHSVILELNGSGRRYGFEDSLIRRLMLDLEFKSYRYDPFERTLTELPGEEIGSGNTLFIRDYALVSERLRNAPRISVLGQAI
jgi:FkbM family methyltransferase